MDLKIYKDYLSRTLGVFLLGSLVFVAGSTFGFAGYASDGLEDYSQYILPALLCFTGVVIIYRAVFRRIVLIADEEELILSYLAWLKI